MPKIFVKPAKDDLKVYKPDMTVLSANGEPVEDNIYWRRRQRDNEIVIESVKPAKKGK
ncbi:MAG: DUF2635 domain-containing protein [Proteobacteria bacterium]|nr:DUF2635 domain-containing protein [Pseudomonadota bacterium]